MSSEYIVDIKPPLISDPEEVWRAQLNELRRNLAAHSAANTTISVAGNKSELRGRLVKLLQRRRDDFLVMGMLIRGDHLDSDGGVGEDSDDNPRSEEED